MSARFIKINSADNVSVAVSDVAAGDICLVDGTELKALEDIPAGHKIALKDMAEGENVIKYGFPIGHLLRSVRRGQLIDHNILKTNLSGVLEYTYDPKPCKVAPSGVTATFKGYRRHDGSVGIRNELWIIPTVGCVNGIVQRLQNLFSEEIPNYPALDRVIAFPHNYGCSQLGDDHENTRHILADMVHHPNAAGVLVVGLGCENNQLSSFRELVGEVDEHRVMFMEAQKVQGDEVSYGLGLLRKIAASTASDRREDVPVSELKVGLKCGGSDGFSGITANPLLGRFSDWLVARGGTAVLTEVPEMFGAETILMSRCRDKATFDKTVHLINDFKEYFIRNGQPVYENPSPGNKAGGISTLEEKSLGCTQKSGHSAVMDVLRYGERLKTKGLNLLSAPGNDLVASTALAAAGCQMVLFTTGRGTPFGTFVPTAKISTNSRLAASKPGWIDFNAGVIVDGKSHVQTDDEFIDFVLSVASGKTVCNERSGYSETAIFKTGVTL
ncbi:MAG: altronate dehydratase [Bacteroidetes bacterium]|uniref:Altronate dehydratase n=1 Tax=Candidatus Cryptobacteroides intestinigallinarum TaxID=2840767 RepID=A0A9D9HMG7_9BACT|nr:altronate dehydratase [Candidatus Cryptobacteroides intestinigallinarum]